MRGNAEVNGVKYTLSNQRDCSSICGGCVANKDAELCKRLPDSCVRGNLIWIKVKSSPVIRACAFAA